MPYSQLYRAVRHTYVDAPNLFEEVLKEIYIAILRPGGVAVDCGCHSGRHTIPMARRVAPDGVVYAFDPIAEKVAVLEGRAAKEGLSDNVYASVSAVGNEISKVEFNYLPDDPGKSAIHLRSEIRLDDVKMSTVEKRHVIVATVDSILALAKACDFIKIDVEGAELSVLEGAKKTIDDYRPVIHFAAGKPSLSAFQVEPQEIFNFMSQNGYNIFDIIGNKMDTRDEFDESTAAGGLYDYIALPSGFCDPWIVASCAKKVFKSNRKK